MKRNVGLLALLAGIGLSGCGGGTPTQLDGTSVAVGAGRAQTRVVLNSNYVPDQVAVHLTTAALNNLPATESETVLALPPGVAAYGIPFDHISLDWNPHGHEPAGIYDAPHFDVHFYTLSSAQRDGILPVASAAVMPASTAIPAGYFPPPNPGSAVVPRMGVHWTSPSTSPEFSGSPFTRTLIYGFANGNLAFVEPMITRDFLMSGGDTSASFTVPQTVAKPGYYPSRYRIQHNSDSTIDIILDQFVQR